MTAPVAVVFNSRADSAPDRDSLACALRNVSLAVDIHTVPDGPIDQWLATLAARYQTLISAGGDGTTSAVAAAAVTHDRTLGVLPTGRLNHFARDAGIPLALDSAAAVIASGQTALLDVGVVNDWIFINNASVGAYPRMVRARSEARRRGLPRPVASAVAMLETWLGLRTVTVRLNVDGNELVRRTPFVFVGNGEYTLEGLELGTRRSLTGGRLSLYVAPGGGRVNVLTLPARALAGRLEAHPHFEAWLASSVEVAMSRRQIAVAVDGELRLFSTPLRFHVTPGRLKVIVPSPEG